MQRGSQKIFQPAREAQRIFRRGFAFGIQKLRVATPADLNAGKQIGFGACHLVQPGRFEFGFFAENIGVGVEANGRAAPVGRLAHAFEFGGRKAA